MIRSFRLAGWLAAAAVMAGCSSAPVHYYTLLPPESPAPAGQAAVPFLIEVLPVGVPAQLDQQSMVVRQGDSGVAVLDTERWSGPLSDEMRTALSSGLSQRLGVPDIAGLARPGGQPLLRIKVQVRRLDAWPGREAQMEAGWSMGQADDQAGSRLVCQGRFRVAAPGSYAELVQAQQRLVADLADRIAQDARLWMASRTGCGPALPAVN
ncbi:MAG: PqiC family protein [Corticimicrobacter sp.]|uniref:PqiC family protein n=1 Tax=Corticimicrobacter sp. TaxID=2678536 RepID=UPI0032DB8B56